MKAHSISKVRQTRHCVGKRPEATNIAVDFNLFQNRLNGSVEFYNKKSSDLLGRLLHRSDPGMEFHVDELCQFVQTEV